MAIEKKDLKLKLETVCQSRFEHGEDEAGFAWLAKNVNHMLLMAMGKKIKLKFVCVLDGEVDLLFLFTNQGLMKFVFNMEHQGKNNNTWYMTSTY
ncbi:unnamed protein product [Eruca vesicaria subsp. sativa]|uniref:Uncharacterized protein n=1 Tax=Eruca vesicaria subsp. sativa TaxID=29727 RepID=A0ABC8KKN2_ERUVS|nr:unnamed protein product [Eruca vesicaria subsp. sativa]